MGHRHHAASIGSAVILASALAACAGLAAGETSVALSASSAAVTAGSPVTLTATVSPGEATGTVTFRDGAAVLGTATLSAGTATLVTSTLAVGAHALTAAYEGSPDHGASTSSAVTVTVSPAGGGGGGGSGGGGGGPSATTTHLTSSASSVTAGASVTLTAHVSPSAASGTVAFLDGGRALGSAPLSGGTATLATSALGVGAHALTAAYEGSATHAASGSSPVTVTVTSAGGTTQTTTALKVMRFSAEAGSDWSTSASVPRGGKVVLVATVSRADATGTVTFQEGGTALGSARLWPGRAVFITSSLGAGAHEVTAVYGGSSTYAGSASGAVTVTVANAGVDCARITATKSFGFFIASYAALQKLSGSTKGFGGNLRFPDRADTRQDAGLGGADTICAVIADMVEEGSSTCKTWRAFLSTAGGAQPTGVTTTKVNAIDRVGRSGPWYGFNNTGGANGYLVAASLADLVGQRPGGCVATDGNKTICNDLPNETGTPNHNPDGTGNVDNHDMLTGSNASGTLYSATATCRDWTSAEYEPGYVPRFGHSWPRQAGGGGGGAANAWLSAMDGGGCTAGVNLNDDFPSDPEIIRSIGGLGGYGGFYCLAVR